MEVFREGNFSVHVYPERGAPHKSPHFHLKVGGEWYASVDLATLSPLRPPNAQLRRAIRERLLARHGEIVRAWKKLHPEERE